MPGLEVEDARRAVELLEHRVEDAAACFHVTPDCGLPRAAENSNRSKYRFANAASQAAQVAAFTVSIRARSRQLRARPSIRQECEPVL